MGNKMRFQVYVILTSLFFKYNRIKSAAINYWMNGKSSMKLKIEGESDN